MRLLHPVGVRNDKNREQELCGKCVRDESPLGFGLAGFFCFFVFGSEAERTSAGTFTYKEKSLAIYCSFAIRFAD